MIGAMDNGTHSTIPFNNEFRGVMNTKGYPGVKVALICVKIILNVIMNSLVIVVIARYPQLREDRTSLFMFSLSVSDLAAWCTFMPISAALCCRNSWTPSTCAILYDVVVWFQLYVQSVLADNLQNDRHPEAIQIRGTSYSQTLLRHHWADLDYWLRTCLVKLHSERKVEFRDMCI